MPVRIKFIKQGGWQTLESYWNATGTAFFLHPANAQVRVRYGGNSWWNGFTRQQQKVNGRYYIKVVVGKTSVLYARIQISVDTDQNIQYDVYPGDVAITSPQVPF